MALRGFCFAFAFGLVGCHLVAGVDDFYKAAPAGEAAASGGAPSTGAAGADSMASGAGASGGGTSGALAHACDDDLGCLSGFCVDGICCDSRCDAGCSACRNEQTGQDDGVCGAVLVGSDPKNVCDNKGLGCATESLCCGEAAAPSANGCPAICNSGCGSNACQVDCAMVKSCYQTTIVCPEGMDCEIDCPDMDSCRDAVVQCPADTECNVTCRNNGACQGLTIECSGGPCSLNCENEESCSDKKGDFPARLRCGTNRCELKSAGALKPKVEQCDQSCSCVVE